MRVFSSFVLLSLLVPLGASYAGGKDSGTSTAFSNVFTPNNDGYNDVFNPAPDVLAAYSLTVYNRWGKEVFKSSTGEAWDGTNAPAGVYVYALEGIASDGTPLNHTGTVTLLR